MAIFAIGHEIPDAFHDYGMFEPALYHYFKNNACTTIDYHAIAASDKWIIDAMAQDADFTEADAVYNLELTFNRLKVNGYVSGVTGATGKYYVLSLFCPWDVSTVKNKAQYARFIDTAHKLTGASVQAIIEAENRIYKNTTADSLAIIYLEGKDEIKEREQGEFN